MTRKDYVALAEALRRSYPQGTPLDVVTMPARYNWENCVLAIADVLAKDNPRFDRQRFVAACQGDK